MGLMAGPICIPHEVALALRYYVYALRDPRDGRVFYVGKGVGDRINSHQREAGKDPASERLKLRRINEIESSGSAVELLFLRTGIMQESTALMIEQSVIDAFAADGQSLTNLVRGHNSEDFGLVSLPVAVSRLEAKPCPPINAPVLMFKIQSGWRPDFTREEIFEKNRGHWPPAAWVRNQAKYALGVAYGVIFGAYRIDSWFPSKHPDDAGKNLWGFNGAEAPELAHVIGTQVRSAFPNQVRYRRFLDGYSGAVEES